MTHFVKFNLNWDELCMCVIYMTHLKDDMKSEFVDRIFLFLRKRFQKF